VWRQSTWWVMWGEQNWTTQTSSWRLPHNRLRLRLYFYGPRTDFLMRPVTPPAIRSAIPSEPVIADINQREIQLGMGVRLWPSDNQTFAWSLPPKIYGQLKGNCLVCADLWLRLMNKTETDKLGPALIYPQMANGKAQSVAPYQFFEPFVPIMLLKCL